MMTHSDAVNMKISFAAVNTMCFYKVSVHKFGVVYKLGWQYLACFWWTRNILTLVIRISSYFSTKDHTVIAVYA